jgi:hypothetical protein
MSKTIKICMSMMLVLVLFAGVSHVYAAEESGAWTGDWTTIGSVFSPNGIKGIAVDSKGDVYMSDPFSQRVLVLPAQSSTWRGLQNSPFSLGDEPWDVAVDSNDTIFVLNSIPATNGTRAVWKYVSSTGEWTDITYGTLFKQPEGIAVSPNGDIYVADTYNNKIRKLGNGSNTWTIVGDDTFAFNMPFTEPRAIGADSEGNIYSTFTIGDESFLCILQSGTTQWKPYSQVIPTNGMPFKDPTDIFVDHFGNIYVTKIVGNELAILANGNNNWAHINKSPDKFSELFGVTVDQNGFVYVSDYADGYGRIHKHQGWAKKLVWKTQPQAGYADEPLTQQPVLWLTDNLGNKMDGVNGNQITVQLTNSGGAVLSNNYAVLNDGVATFSNLMVDRAGTYSLTASGMISHKDVWYIDNPYQLPPAISITISSSSSFTAIEKPRAATPTASPSSGTVIHYTSEVTLSCSTPSATLYYTVDGSTPSSSSTSGGIVSIPYDPSTDTLTIKAFATASDMSDSSISEFTYTVDYSDVTPSNNMPSARIPVSTQNVYIGEITSFNAADIAEDLDNDILTITSFVSETDLTFATASLEAGIVTITGVSEGETSIIVRVSDGIGTIDVTVPISVSEIVIPVSAVISPTTGNFDKYSIKQSDVIINITWNSATSVKDVKMSDMSIGHDNFTVSGNSLTIKKEYLEAQSEGNIILLVEFNVGDASIFTIDISDSTPQQVNHAPSLKVGVPSKSSVNILLNTKYTLDLASLFEDADSDPLTFCVSINNLGSTEAMTVYEYTPILSGDTILEFKANDGKMDSMDTYTVTLTASKPLVQTHTLTLIAGAGGSVTVGINGNYEAGTVIDITATTFNNYRFNKWTSTEGGLFGNMNSAITTFVMPSNPVVITADFSYTGGVVSDDSSEKETTKITKVPVSNNNANVSGNGTTVSIPVTFDSEKNITTVSLGSIQGDIILSGKTVVVTVPAIPGVDTYAVGIPIAYLSTPDGKGTLTFNTNTGSINIPTDMMSGIAGVAGDNVEIVIGRGDKSSLPDSVKAFIGDRPLIHLEVVIDGNKVEWNNPNSPVIVSIPYTPTVEELSDPEHINIWYIDGQGNVVTVPSGRYDPVTGMVTFKITHFSNYAITYKIRTFDDLNSVPWAKHQIQVLASKEIIKEKNDDTFGPQDKITRAEFLYSLVRTLGIDSAFVGNFDDIDPECYYYNEVAIARKRGIASGTGNNQFSPDVEITRQDMMVLTERTIRMLNKLQTTQKSSNLDRFVDKSFVSAYAVDCIASLVNEGLIVGNEDNINPLGNATRAEAAVFLYKIYNKY